jgi:circadian clock protein KaiC
MSHEAWGPEGQAEDSPIKRLATGKRELDEILGGGIPANSINIIMGEPGSGKTTLAEEFIFANADDDGRTILYLTTLSEPLDKVMAPSAIPFLRPDQDGRYGPLRGVGTDLATNGVGALPPSPRTAIKTLSPISS